MPENETRLTVRLPVSVVASMDALALRLLLTRPTLLAHMVGAADRGKSLQEHMGDVARPVEVEPKFNLRRCVAIPTDD